MKKSLVIVLVSLFLCSVSFAEGLKLTGNVGGYDIEMIIETSVYETGELTGKYRYLSQEDFLIIKGDSYGEVIYLEEFYDGKQTGTFYLENVDNQLTGWWVNEKKVFEVELNVEDGDKTFLDVKGREEFSAECNSDISGTYEVAHYFINDYFVSENNPVYELGYNGGRANFIEQEDGSLKFEIEMICGPTYHSAIAEGIAVKDGDEYVYGKDLFDEGICEIRFKFNEKKVSAISNNGYACGFGVRAYIDHELIKVKDIKDTSIDTE